MYRKALLVIIGLTTAVTTACGDAGGGSADDPAVKTVAVKMVDIAYEPDEISVQKGQEVRFVFANEGKVRHEAYLGDADAQAEHGQEMMAGDGGGGHDAHGGGNPKVTVDPGKEGDLTHRFDQSGTFEIGCHEPGHYDAGMKVTVVVT